MKLEVLNPLAFSFYYPNFEVHNNVEICHTIFPAILEDILKIKIHKLDLDKGKDLLNENKLMTRDIFLIYLLKITTCGITILRLKEKINLRCKILRTTT